MPIYMKIDGVQGEARAKGYEGWIEIMSFSWGLTQTGGAAFSDLNVMTQMGLSAPRLMLACALGKPYKSLIFAKNDGTQEYYRYTLENVLVTSFQQSHSNGEAPDPNLALSFNYSKITYRAFYQRADGTYTSMQNFWDLALGQGG